MYSRVQTVVVVAIFCGFSLVSQWAYAQQPAPPDKDEASPSPTAKELSFLLGKWKTEIQVSPNETMPEGVKGTGVAEYRLFGEVIECTRSSDSPSRGHHEEKDFFVYNDQTGAYDMVCISAKGHFTVKTMTKFVDVFVVEYTGQKGEKEFSVRGKYKIISEDEVQYSSEIKVGKSGFKPYVEVHMKRVKD